MDERLREPLHSVISDENDLRLDFLMNFGTISSTWLASRAIVSGNFPSTLPCVYTTHAWALLISPEFQYVWLGCVILRLVLKPVKTTGSNIVVYCMLNVIWKFSFSLTNYGPNSFFVVFRDITKDRLIGATVIGIFF